MPVKEVRDVAYSTGGALTSPSTVPGSGKPWLTGPVLEPDDQIVLDTNPSTPTALFFLAIVNFIAPTSPAVISPNAGQWAFLQCTSANIVLPETMRGIVTQQATDLTINQQMRITIRGPVVAAINPGGGGSVAGTAMQSTNAGRLTPAGGSPAYGTILAFSMTVTTGGGGNTTGPVLMGNP